MEVCCIFSVFVQQCDEEPFGKRWRYLHCEYASKAQMVIEWKVREENNDDTQ